MSDGRPNGPEQGQLPPILEEIKSSLAKEGRYNKSLNGVEFTQVAVSLVGSLLQDAQVSQGKTEIQGSQCTLAARVDTEKGSIDRLELKFNSDSSGRLNFLGYEGIPLLKKLAINAALKLKGQGNLDDLIKQNLGDPNTAIAKELNKSWRLSGKQGIDNVSVIIKNGQITFEMRTGDYAQKQAGREADERVKREEQMKPAQDYRVRRVGEEPDWLKEFHAQEEGKEKKPQESPPPPSAKLPEKPEKKNPEERNYTIEKIREGKLRVAEVVEESGRVVIMPVNNPKFPSENKTDRDIEEEIASISTDKEIGLSVYVVDTGQYVGGFKKEKYEHAMPYMFRIKEGASKEAAAIEQVLKDSQEQGKLKNRLAELDTKWEKAEITPDSETESLIVWIKDQKENMRKFHVGIMDKGWGKGCVVRWSVFGRESADKEMYPPREVLTELCQITSVVTNLWLEAPIAAKSVKSGKGKIKTPPKPPEAAKQERKAKTAKSEESQEVEVNPNYLKEKETYEKLRERDLTGIVPRYFHKAKFPPGAKVYLLDDRTFSVASPTAKAEPVFTIDDEGVGISFDAGYSELRIDVNRTRNQMGYKKQDWIESRNWGWLKMPYNQGYILVEPTGSEGMVLTSDEKRVEEAGNELPDLEFGLDTSAPNIARLYFSLARVSGRKLPETLPPEIEFNEETGNLKIVNNSGSFQVNGKGDSFAPLQQGDVITFENLPLAVMVTKLAGKESQFSWLTGVNTINQAILERVKTLFELELDEGVIESESQGEGREAGGDPARMKMLEEEKLKGEQPEERGQGVSGEKGEYENKLEKMGLHAIQKRDFTREEYSFKSGDVKLNFKEDGSVEDNTVLFEFDKQSGQMKYRATEKIQLKQIGTNDWKFENVVFTDVYNSGWIKLLNEALQPNFYWVKVDFKKQLVQVLSDEECFKDMGSKNFPAKESTGDKTIDFMRQTSFIERIWDINFPVVDKENFFNVEDYHINGKLVTGVGRKRFKPYSEGDVVTVDNVPLAIQVSSKSDDNIKFEFIIGTEEINKAIWERVTEFGQVVFPEEEKVQEEMPAPGETPQKPKWRKRGDQRREEPESGRKTDFEITGLFDELPEEAGEEEGLKIAAQALPMPTRLPPKSRLGISRAAISNALVEWGFDIRKSETAVFLSLVASDKAADPVFLALSGGLYLLSAWSNFFKKGIPELRKANERGLLKVWSQGFVTGAISVACGEIFDLTSRSSLSHSLAKSVLIRTTFNYLIPRALSTFRSDEQVRKAFSEGIRLGVVVFTGFPVIVNLLEHAIEERELEQPELAEPTAEATGMQAQATLTPGHREIPTETNVPTQTAIPPTQTATAQPATAIPSSTPIAPSVTPVQETPTPIETLTATATQLATGEAGEFLKLFEGIESLDELDQTKFMEHLNNLLFKADPEQLAAAHITKHSSAVYLIDPNGDGAAEFIRRNGMLFERTVDGMYKQAFSDADQKFTFEQLTK